VPIRYRSADEDSARWLGFPFRPGDIVISTRSKSGTTWVQMICALLVFQTSDLPAPLSELSPWLDWLVTPRDEVVALLDMAVSLYHQGDNLDRERIRRLTGQPEPDGQAVPRPPLHEWLVSWIDRDVRPREEMDSLPGVMWHLSDAWARRDEPNVVLVHYDDLSADLEGEMRRLASLLDITVPEPLWPDLVRAATFEHMKARADTVVPDPSGVLKDSQAFFRRGTSGAGSELLTDEELAHYETRTAQLAPPNLLAWLHR
jgi:hypothetical protein